MLRATIILNPDSLLERDPMIIFFKIVMPPAMIPIRTIQKLGMIYTTMMIHEAHPIPTFIMAILQQDAPKLSKYKIW
jgi:hypothetical protein